MDLEEAHGGTQHMEANVQRGDAGDPFPGTSGKTSFTDATDPSAKLYGDINSRIVIDRISASSTNMTALVYRDFAAATLDTIAPNTGCDAKASYYGAATITLTPSDGTGYGTQLTNWMLDGVPGTGGVVATSALGSHTLQYRSTDWAGNAEETKTAAFSVFPADLVAPVTSCDASASYVGTATITLSPLDSGSGVARTDWTLDSVAGSGTVVISSPGAHTLRYWSTDRAGNVEAPKSATFTVIGDTTMSLAAAPSTVIVGASVRLSGLVSVGPGVPIPSSERVRLQRLVGGSWVDAGLAEAAVSSNGAYAFVVKMLTRQTYRSVTSSACVLSAAESPQVVVQVGVALGTPSVPRRIKPKKTFSTAGTVRPAHGGTVRVEWYKVVKGKLRLYSAKTVKVSSKGTWSVKRSLPKASWAVRSVHEDAQYARTASAYKKFTVK